MGRRADALRHGCDIYEKSERRLLDLPSDN